MKLYVLTMVVETTLEFASDQAALDWIENHTVFDLLNEGGGVTDTEVANADDGSLVTR